MATVFEKINGDDAIFANKEYISDSLMFNSIESARLGTAYDIFSDHKNVIILTSKEGHRVWLWTSSVIKEDTNKLIDICRFIRDCKIPRAEIYLKQDVAGSFSDLYALTTLEINYVVKDEFSLAVYTYSGEKISESNETKLENDDQIVKIDRNNKKHVDLIREYYGYLKEEFRWTGKFDRKVDEYLDTDLYALFKNDKIIAVASIGNGTEKYLRIKSVSVLTEYRRRGFGYKMTAYAVNRILERELVPVLYTHIGNASAVALWAKVGFKEKDKLYLLKVENNDL